MPRQPRTAASVTCKAFRKLIGTDCGFTYFGPRTNRTFLLVIHQAFRAGRDARYMLCTHAGLPGTPQRVAVA